MRVFFIPSDMYRERSSALIQHVNCEGAMHFCTICAICVAVTREAPKDRMSHVVPDISELTFYLSNGKKNRSICSLFWSPA